MNAKTLLAGSTIALALAAAAATPANAVTIIHLTPSLPGTISSSTGIKNGQIIEFTFTVPAPYHFTFTDTGSGGTYPFPISFTATGGAGNYTETYGPFPVKGTLSYSLTTSVPEPATWALMIVGVGFAGASLRRRVRAQVAA